MIASCKIKKDDAYAGCNNANRKPKTGDNTMKQNTSKTITSAINTDTEKLAGIIAQHGKLNETPSKAGYKTFKDQGMIISYLLNACLDWQIERFLKAFMALPDSTKQAIDYGRKAFPEALSGMIATPETMTMKARLSAHEEGAKIRNAIYTALANNPKLDHPAIMRKLLTITDYDQAGLLAIATEIAKA